jgi:hypothetical protein
MGFAYVRQALGMAGDLDDRHIYGYVTINLVDQLCLI